MLKWVLAIVASALMSVGACSADADPNAALPIVPTSTSTATVISLPSPTPIASDVNPPTPAPTAVAVTLTPTPTTTVAAPAFAGRRVALVIANSAYRDAALKNPPTDAKLVAQSLEKAGFAVAVKENVTLDEFEEALSNFAETAHGADVALLYFVGHGFSIASGGRQEDMLMTTNADFHAKTAFELEMGGETLKHVEYAIRGQARATLVFIDACRQIPVFNSVSNGFQGFAQLDVSAFDGAFVVLSTRQGRTTEDGPDGKGSPFARAFAAALPTPRLHIEDFFMRIREMVRAETAGQQIPDLIRDDLPDGGLVLTPQPP